MHKLKGNHNNVGEFVGLFLESRKLFPLQNQIFNPLTSQKGAKYYHFQIQEDFFSCSLTLFFCFQIAEGNKCELTQF